MSRRTARAIAWCRLPGTRCSERATGEHMRRRDRRAPRKRAAPFRCRLVVMAKVPVAGRAKTRLAREIGVAAATRFARQATAALLQRVARDPALADHPRRCARCSGRERLLAARHRPHRAGPRRPRPPHAAHHGAHAAGAGGDRRHGRARHHAGASSPKRFAGSAATTPCSARRRTAATGWSVNAAAARAATHSPTCAGRAGTRSPIRWPTSRAGPSAFVATLSDVDDAREDSR